MLSIRAEILATLLVLATLVGVPLWALREEARATALAEGEDVRVITMTAVADGGIWTFEEQCKLYLEKGPSRVSPFFVPMFIPDIASGLVSIRWGAKGPNYCTVSACALDSLVKCAPTLARCRAATFSSR